MSRVPRIILITSLTIFFFGGRIALAHDAQHLANACYLAASNNFAGLPLRIPVAGVDIEEVTGKARVCLSMVNTLVRRCRKRPINSAATASGVPTSANIRPLDEGIAFDPAANFPL